MRGNVPEPVDKPVDEKAVPLIARRLQSLARYHDRYQERADANVQLVDAVPRAVPRGTNAGRVSGTGSAALYRERPVPRGGLIDGSEPPASLEPWIVSGRETGHAPGRCTECGTWAMVAIRTTSGARRGTASSPWPRCRMTPRCDGRTAVPEVRLVGVAPKRPPSIPRAPKSTRQTWRAITTEET